DRRVDSNEPLLVCPNRIRCRLVCNPYPTTVYVTIQQLDEESSYCTPISSVFRPFNPLSAECGTVRVQHGRIKSTRSAMRQNLT
ncbi:MAG: hypothetical protein WBK72_01710, partial [Bacillota bacterium]